MRIAFITFEYPPFIIGGAGIYAFNITHELARRGHQVVIFTPDVLESPSQSDFYNLRIQKIPINKQLPFKALQFWLLLPNEVRKLEKDTKFDILHFNGISYWFLNKRISKAKHIVTIHHLIKDTIKNNELNFISRIKDISGENGFFMSFLERKCIKSPDKLIAVSNFTKNQIINYYNIAPYKIEVIHNGVDSNGYSLIYEEIQESKKQLNLLNQPILLFVGRVDDPRKGLDFLLKSMKKVLKKMNVALLVIGKGDQTQARKLVDYLGISSNVIFTGFVDNYSLKKYYFLCDIYVCPSRLEGFGLTIIEAMMAGKPVVATNVGAIPEIIKDKINGILVESGDIDGMCDAIFNLLKNQKMIDIMGEKNAKEVSDKYNWSKNARKILKIYNHLVNK